MQSVVGRTLELEQQLAQVKQQHAQQDAASGGELQGVHKLINRVSSVSAMKHCERERSSFYFIIIHVFFFRVAEMFFFSVLKTEKLVVVF